MLVSFALVSTEDEKQMLWSPLGTIVSTDPFMPNGVSHKSSMRDLKTMSYHKYTIHVVSDANNVTSVTYVADVDEGFKKYKLYADERLKVFVHGNSSPKFREADTSIIYRRWPDLTTYVIASLVALIATIALSFIVKFARHVATSEARREARDNRTLDGIRSTKP